MTNNLGDIDTSLITEFYGNYKGNNVGLFQSSSRTDYRGIENWNVSNVTNMQYMFYSVTSFNQDISMWNVNKVIYWLNFNLNCPGLVANNKAFTPPKFR